ncbi:ABC transporter substrate-binding protein [soil metagenome]
MRGLFTIALAIFMVGSACTSSTPPGTATLAPEAGTAVAGGRIIQGVADEITGLQPILSGDSSELVWGHFYPRLMQNNPDTGVLVPGLAESWSQSPDGKTVTFNLRKNVKWSDGVPFTGEDYKYSVEATVRAKAPIRRPVFSRVVGFQDYAEGKTDSISGLVVSADGMTVTMQLTGVLCTAVRSLVSAGGGILPKHHFVKTWDNKTTDVSKSIDTSQLNDAPPASLGPWVFKEWQKGVQVTMTKNPNYWRGAPLLDEYIVKSYANDAAVKAALLTGEITFAYTIPTDVEEIQKTAGNKLALSRESIATNYQYIGWNNKSVKAPWLGNKDVRQALWYGLNVKAIIDRVQLGYATQMYSHYPKQSFVYEATGLKTYDYNVATAKSLLEKAGAKMGADGVYVWSNGQPMSMRLEGGQGASSIMQVAQEQYKAIGVKIDPIVQTLPVINERFDPTNLDNEGHVGLWNISPDPDSAWIFFNAAQQGKGNFNRVHYENADVTKALDAGRLGPDCTDETRKKLYQTVNKQLNEDAPYTWLWQPESLIFHSTALQNFVQKPYGLTTSGETWDWNAEKLWLKK